jgi:GTP-binding protein
MVIDEARITVKAGNGGPGRVSFFPGGGKTGPDGGNGGRGGDVYARANRQYTSLERYTSQTTWKGIHGGQGGGFRRQGKDGDPTYLEMPVGTMLLDEDTGQKLELEKDGQTILLVKGGKGGRGNDSFKSSTNTTPLYAQPGLRGQQRIFRLIMRYIADIGLIGLPNAGKSSLLNELTAANVKTANYPFTTLEPNLGTLDGKVLADIPGLIEGASTGKGLGTRFLKHVEKVSLLVHCIAVDSEDPLKDYNTVRAELAKHNPELVEKPEIILLTKTDLSTPDVIKKQITRMKRKNKNVSTVSIHDWDAIQSLRKLLHGSID